jgi:hypothetical protein
VADPPRRTTADLADYPDLVVIYLGMRAEEPGGGETLDRLGPQIRGLTTACASTGATSTRSRPGPACSPHKEWWTDYLRDRGGTSFWHETYFRRGGIESAFVDVPDGTVGLNRFAAMVRSEGPMLSARLRLEKDREAAG